MVEKLLLIAPRKQNDNEEVSPLNAFDASIGGFEMTPSTSIATVAELAPEGIEVTLCNEITGPLDVDAQATVIGITANVGQARRALQIAKTMREKGKTVVMGGPYVTLVPTLLEGACDTIVTGEVEAITEPFFADMEAGTLKPRYTGPQADMTTSPASRWDPYPVDRVVTGVVRQAGDAPSSATFATSFSAWGVCSGTSRSPKCSPSSRRSTTPTTARCTCRTTISRSTAVAPTRCWRRSPP